MERRLSAFVMAIAAAATGCRSVDEVTVPARVKPFDAPPSVALNFEVIPYAEPDIMAPGRGAERWHMSFDVGIPTEEAPGQPLDVYQRFTWSRFETSGGVYDWTDLDTWFREAIDLGMRLSLGVMVTCPGCGGTGLLELDGSISSYPADLHNAMQNEAVPDWSADGTWVPNWNSETFLTRFETFLLALAAHLADTSHAGVTFQDALGYVDVRGYGSWGAWVISGIMPTADEQPPGSAAEVATLERIIDAHVSAFPSVPLLMPLGAFEGGRFASIAVPAEVGHYALTVQNAFGPLGWRSDDFGVDDTFHRALVEDNPTEFAGVSFAQALLNRWQTAPVVAELAAFGATGACEYDDLESQVRRYRVSAVSNGKAESIDIACVRDNIRAAAKASGYRLVLAGGTVTEALTSEGPLHVELAWQNVGIAPVYEPWTVRIELRRDGVTLWSDRSSFSPTKLLPATSPTTVRDTFELPALGVGSYELVLTITDPRGYRAPLPLAVRGQRADGAYLLRSYDIE